MIGSIIGDIVGSVYEFDNIKTKNFTLFARHARFTDDSVATIAIFKALNDSHNAYMSLSKEEKEKLKKSGHKYPYIDLDKHTIKRLQEYGRNYIYCGFADMFKAWVQIENPEPYNSWGNGSAMRVSSVAFFAKSLAEVKYLSYQVTAVTHNHPNGIMGAEAVAVAVYMALHGKTKQQIKNYIERKYFSLDFDYEDLRKNYTFQVGCKNSVPQAIYCFLISTDFIDAIRTAVSIGGDCDTITSMVGAMAEAYYGVPKKCVDSALLYLPEELKNDYNEFNSLFPTREEVTKLTKN